MVEQGLSKRKFSTTCARFGYFELAKWGHSQNCLLWGAITAAVSAETPEPESLSFMKWARSEGSQIFSATISRAAKKGSLEIVKWLMEEAQRCLSENGGRKEKENEGKEGEKGEEDEEEREEREFKEELRKRDRREKGEDAMSKLTHGAASGGNLEILRWAKEKGFLYTGGDYLFSPDPEVLEFLDTLSPHGLDEWQLRKAIKKGNLDYLKWVAIKEPKLLRLSYLTNCNEAIKGNHVEILKWYHGNSTILVSDTDCRLASNIGNFEITKWMRDSLGIGWDKIKSKDIAKSGNIELLKWARDHGCPWKPSTCSGAATSGNFEMLKWVHKHGCPLSDNLCYKAAASGNPEILKWAREHGCSWDVSTCAAAAKKGNLETLKWARDQGCPWDNTTCFAAITENHIEILDWAFRNGCPCTSEEVFRHAAQHGKLKALIWAKKNLPFPQNLDGLLILAINCFSDPSYVLTWMQRNGIILPESISDLIQNSDKLYALLWLIKHKLPVELRGAWREMEEVWWVKGPGGWRTMVREAKEVLRGEENIEKWIKKIKKGKRGW
jgi:hypothetical protein